MEFKMKPYTKDTELPDYFMAKVLESNRCTNKRGTVDAFVVEYITTGQVIGDSICLYDMEENTSAVYKGFPSITEFDDMRSCITITEWCPLPKIAITDNSKLSIANTGKLYECFGDAWNKPLEDEVKPL